MHENKAPDSIDTAGRPVTFLMTAYNSEQTVSAAICSLLEQTYSDFSLLVVDDGSTDRTGDIVRRIAATDGRVNYLRIEHAGVCAAANAGLSRIRSRYVARMDADDISHPARLTRQMEFLRNHPEVKVLGTYAYSIANSGRRITKMGNGPTTLEQYIEFRARRQPFFVLNSSVVADRDVLISYGGYQQDDFPADDVALYTRISRDHPVLTIPEYLVEYRLTPGGVTASHQWRMIAQFAKFDYNLQRNESINFEGFLKRLEAHPLLKFRIRWGALHKWTVRYGAYHLFNGSPWKGLLFLVCGAALEPHRGLQKLMRANLF